MSKKVYSGHLLFNYRLVFDGLDNVYYGHLLLCLYTLPYLNVSVTLTYSGYLP